MSSAVRHRRRSARRQSLGQVMALGVVTMLVLAFMMMLSFNLTNVVHEKIRLQSHSDAMAYSMATIEARAFNYFAYSNRAIAAVLVAQMTVHAYMSAMSVTSDIMRSGRDNFYMIAGIEFAICATCCWPGCVSNCEHCIHGIEALQIAGDYNDAKDDYGDKVKDLESTFNMVVEMLSRHADMIHMTQMGMTLYLAQSILMGQDLGELKQRNAPCATDLEQGVGGLNVAQMACALEGAITDQLCVNRNTVSKEGRSKILQNAANAARPPFTKERPPFFPLHLGPQFLQEFMTDIPGSDGMSIPLNHSGTAKVTNGTSESDCTSSAQDVEGSTVCAVESGNSFSYWKHGVGFSSYSSLIASDENGGAHEPGQTHDPDHDKFKGAQAGDGDMGMECFDIGNCFINFHGNDSADEDYGQPKVYAYHKQDLRIRDTQSCNANRPWELGDDGQLTMNDGARGDATLTFYPQQEGRAVSKAMVYFHRFDTWKAPPNMFDPYWRAKLHPFNKQEVIMVLGAAGDGDGATMATGPVEGQL